MIKNIKFSANLVPLIFSGDKTSTWRLFDDKDLSVGDVLNCYVSETGAYFAVIEIVDVSEKPLGELEASDWQGHEQFESTDLLYETYKKYYPNNTIGPETLVKIVRFQLLET